MDQRFPQPLRHPDSRRRPEGTTRKVPFTYDADHPEVLVGSNQAPTPVEFLPHAIAACLTAGLANIAAARGITLHRVSSTVEGDIDLLGLLGLSGGVRNGYRQIRVQFEVEGDASSGNWQRSLSNHATAPPSTTCSSTELMCRSMSALRDLWRRDLRGGPGGSGGWDVVIIGAGCRHSGVAPRAPACACWSSIEPDAAQTRCRRMHSCAAASCNCGAGGWSTASRQPAHLGAPRHLPLRRGIIAVTLKPYAGVDALYAPRRTILDALLVDAAEEAGAQFRFGAAMTDLVRNRTGRVFGVVLRDHDGGTWTEHAELVIGADGRDSSWPT